MSGFDQAEAKREVGRRAAELVEDGQRLGLGSGSTVAAFLVPLAERVEDEDLDIVGVATSHDTERRCDELGIPTTTLDDEPELDLAIDGADEVAPGLDLIKGGGGALFREKVVAESSDRFVAIVDSTKEAAQLGESFELPIEVAEYALPLVRRELADLDPTRREADRGQPFRTDNDNLILDLATGPIEDPHALAKRLDSTVGVLEHGLFLDVADRCLVGTEKGVNERQN
jgi:ribose 5-phosphate isomerase A